MGQGMRPIQRIISVGFATAAFASAAMPILSIGASDADSAGVIASADFAPTRSIAAAKQPIQLAFAAEPTLGGPSRR